MRRFLLPCAVAALLSCGAAHADILYCAPGDGQVIIKNATTTLFTSDADVRSVVFAMVLQLPGNERIDLVYKDGRKDSFILNGESFSEFHNLARQPGDGRGRCP